jgi:hypothetical protein
MKKPILLSILFILSFLVVSFEMLAKIGEDLIEGLDL